MITRVFITKIVEPVLLVFIPTRSSSMNSIHFNQQQICTIYQYPISTQGVYSFSDTLSKFTGLAVCYVFIINRKYLIKLNMAYLN